jgi:hypothetical protein
MTMTNDTHPTADSVTALSLDESRHAAAEILLGDLAASRELFNRLRETLGETRFFQLLDAETTRRATARAAVEHAARDAAHHQLSDLGARGDDYVALAIGAFEVDMREARSLSRTDEDDRGEGDVRQLLGLDAGAAKMIYVHAFLDEMLQLGATAPLTRDLA